MALGGFGPAIDSLASSAGSLLDAVGLGGLLGEEGGAVSGLYQSAKNLNVFNGELVPWTYSGQDWHKVFPYQFVVIADPGEGNPNKQYIYTLPIPPQSMVLKMVPASQATPTVGGVVEETSDNVFWIIQMAGTTGTGVSREGLPGTEASRKDMAKKFRRKLETTGLLSGVAANLNSLIGTVGGTADAVLNAGQAFASGDIASGIGGVVGAVNNLLLPQLPYSGSGVDEKTNGYTEMQELHRFLYTFSNLKGVAPNRFVLEFRNFKLGKKWRVVLQDFTIQQSMQNPNLYRYNIQLKAWSVRPIDQAERQKNEFDRFAPGGDLAAVNTVGVDGLYKGFKALSGIMKGESTNTIADAYLKPLGG